MNAPLKLNDQDRELIAGLVHSAGQEPCAEKRRDITRRLCAEMGRLNLTLADLGFTDRIEDRGQQLHLPGATRRQ